MKISWSEARVAVVAVTLASLCAAGSTAQQGTLTDDVRVDRLLQQMTRPVVALPGDQDQLIYDIAAANPNTIVVLNVSQPVAMPWLREVKAVLQMWWPRDEGGPATANLLLGRANPGGRLPFAWPKRLEDTTAGDPAFPERSANGVDGKTTFTEGVLVGYRWFDHRKIEPLFPFGFGLSYTSFAIANAKASSAGDGGFDVSMSIRNTGAAAGDEVPQVYIDKPERAPAGVQFADRILAGFDRVHLDAGESKVVSIHIAPRQFQYWSVSKHQWVTPTGIRTFTVAALRATTGLRAVLS